MYPSSPPGAVLPRFLIQLIGEVRLHRRPFAGDDAVDDRITQRAVGGNLMTAQNAVLLCTQTLDAAPALMVEEMGAEFDCDTIKLLERMRQQQQLALRVESPAWHT